MTFSIKLLPRILLWGLSIVFFRTFLYAESTENSGDKNESSIILFDGKSLDDWKLTDYAGKGDVEIDQNGSLVIEIGAELSGIHWKGRNLPKVNYEITLEAMRTMGSDLSLIHI